MRESTARRTRRRSAGEGSVAMFGAVTLIVGSIVFLDLAGRSRDMVAYRRLDAVAQRTDSVAVALFVVGVVLGLLTALAGDFDVTAGWLIMAYILVGALLVEGFFFTLPWYATVREGANDPDAARAASEVKRLFTHTSSRRACDRHRPALGRRHIPDGREARPLLASARASGSARGLPPARLDRRRPGAREGP